MTTARRLVLAPLLPDPPPEYDVSREREFRASISRELIGVHASVYDYLDQRVVEIVEITPGPPPPAWLADTSQLGTVGTLDLQLFDPFLMITAEGTVSTSDGGTAWEVGAGTSGTAGSDVVLNRRITVPLSGKHNSWVTWSFPYTVAGVGSAVIGTTHILDHDDVAHIRSVNLRFDAAGALIVEAVGDEDTQDMFITADDGVVPADPTILDDTILGESGSVTSSATITGGNTAFVKVRGRNFRVGSALGPIWEGGILKPEDVVVPEPPQIEVSITGTTVGTYSTTSATTTLDYEVTNYPVGATLERVSTFWQTGYNAQTAWSTASALAMSDAAYVITLNHAKDSSGDPMVVYTHEFILRTALGVQIAYAKVQDTRTLAGPIV